MTQYQLLPASFKLLPCHTMHKEMNRSSCREKTLITMRILCHSFSPPSLSFFLPLARLSFFPFYLFHLSVPLSIYFLWCLPFPTLCPSFPPFKRWTGFLFFHYFLFTSSVCVDSLSLSKSLCHSHCPHLQYLPSLLASLSVFPKNSINQSLAGFLTYDYLWSRTTYHFHAADKCTEYSTQARQAYFITD